MPQACQISYHYLPIVGGQQVYTEELNGVLRSLGLEPTVIQRWRRVAQRHPRTKMVFTFPFGGRLLRDWDWHLFSICTMLRQSGTLKKTSLIIVHYAVHSPAVWRNRKKAIVISHGVEWNREKMGLEDRLRAWIARKSFQAFVTVANDTDYLREMGLTASPETRPFSEVAPGIWYVPNCVDTARFKRVAPFPEYSKPRVIIVPRQIVRVRGIDLALLTFAELSRQVSDLLLLVVGGPTHGDYYEYCVGLAAKLGISDRVVFTGSRPHEEMPRLFSSARACLIPTLHREGTSLSALEAMACGVPTVSTDVGGLRDLPSLKGAPVPARLADALLRCLNDGGQIGKAQERSVRSTYTLDNWRSAWANVIKSVESNAHNDVP